MLARELPSQYQRNLTSVEVAWSLMLPHWQIPNVAIVGGWLKHNPANIVLDAIEEVSTLYNLDGKDDDHVGRIVSIVIRRLAKIAQNNKGQRDTHS